MGKDVRMLTEHLDERVREVIAQAEAFIADKDDAWALPAEAARFVHAMVRACGAKRFVEIGTSYGYSGLWIGAAVGANGGTMVTIDKEARKREIADNFFAEAGLGDVITCATGEAAAILAELTGPIDGVLNDADKENCVRYVELVYLKMPVGGVILTDNAVSNEIVREQFVPWVRRDGRFASGLADVGNGIEISIKLG
jgi:predicted O-methyltransferase YrrM